MKESEKKDKGKVRKTAQLFSLDKEEKPSSWRTGKYQSNMWFEQSRFKVTFMHEISRMTTSLTVTKLKLETESHADEQTFRITRDAGFTFFGHKLKLGV